MTVIDLIHYLQAATSSGLCKSNDTVLFIDSDLNEELLESRNLIFNQQAENIDEEVDEETASAIDFETFVHLFDNNTGTDYRLAVDSIKDVACYPELNQQGEHQGGAFLRITHHSNDVTNIYYNDQEIAGYCYRQIISAMDLS